MGGYISKENEKVNYLNVEVLCHCYNEGEIKPIRAKILENEQAIVLSVTVISKRLKNHNGNPIVIYECKSEDNGRIYHYELHFEKFACTWRIF